MSRVLAVTGKGGTGKTTVAALIIRHLKKNGLTPVLAVDADPDANLATVLGMDVEGSIGDVREDALKKVRDLPAGMSKQAYLQAGLHQVVAESEGVDLLSMGRSEGPGCYCAINNMVRHFSDELTPSYPWVVMDNEAGLEHLSRRTTDNVDALITVINESPLALHCALRVDELVADIKNNVRRKFFLINATREERIDTVRERAETLDMEYLGSIPPDPRLEQLIFEGRSIYELDGGPAVLKMNEVMKRLGEL
jgi:CO dehydrogenase maturation factor